MAVVLLQFDVSLTCVLNCFYNDSLLKAQVNYYKQLIYINS